MIVAPWRRASFSRLFILGAISVPRRVAFRQWCRSHMSQTITAVWSALHLTGRLVLLCPLPHGILATWRERTERLKTASSAAWATRETRSVNSVDSAKVQRMVSLTKEEKRSSSSSIVSRGAEACNRPARV